MHAERRAAYRHEELQVLLTVPFGFVHLAFYLVAFYLIVVVGPLVTLFVIAVGALEIAAGQKLLAAPAVLRQWLLGAGVGTIAFSIGCLVFTLSLHH